MSTLLGLQLLESSKTSGPRPCTDQWRQCRNESITNNAWLEYCWRVQLGVYSVLACWQAELGSTAHGKVASAGRPGIIYYIMNMLHYNVLHCIALYCTVLYYTTLCYIMFI